MAFGNKLLPCPLRTSGGRPLLGGQPPGDAETEGDADIEGRHVCDGPNEIRGRARIPAGGKSAPSRRRGMSTGAKEPSRGGGSRNLVESKNPRQPSKTERLFKERK